MANVHVLERNGNRTRVVLHIPVPAGNNAAGIPWRTAIVASGLGGTTILKDGDGTGGTISAAEKTAITSTGSVLEVIQSIKNADVSNAGLEGEGRG